MIIADIILAFILALFFAVIFNVAMRSRQRALPIAFIFILFFLFAWAGGLWIRPLGPPVFWRVLDSESRCDHLDLSGPDFFCPR